MRPAVLTAALLLVGILNTVTAQSDVKELCAGYTDEPCDDGWSLIGEDLCVKYFETPKSFSDAEEECSKLDADLVQLASEAHAKGLICFSWKINPELHKFWIGIRKSGEKFVYKDGAELGHGLWGEGQPDNFGGNEECVETNFKDWGKWNDNVCSKEKPFVCGKIKMQ